jgi:hypothetical protein
VGGAESKAGTWPWAVIVGKPKDPSFQVDTFVKVGPENTINIQSRPLKVIPDYVFIGFS